ncbi:MAG: 16S rRNA (cytidine(1402)-2'-O)-methyltransferase [Lachnospiraceae bacterium]|nr:16S rRNA (cytidine(1402)-2'-O)-methyltransferase [Lachnospiraceae bacterium]
MSGILYICATPIGNLKDMTPRVIETLKSVDLIAAEDTRNSIKLLNAFDIDTPMTSYHEYNRLEKGRVLVDKLKSGMNIALITDAGTPAISDPGELLVTMCHENDITVTSLPGPAALIVALSLSGLPTRRFCFEAFLPVDKKERKLILNELKTETRTIILYEAPHHLKNTLKELYETLGDRKITVCRELTKKFEEIMPLTLNKAIEYYEENDPRGEYVLVIEGMGFDELKEQKEKEFDDISIKDHMERYISEGYDEKAAMKAVAADRGISKRDVYQAVLEYKNT